MKKIIFTAKAPAPIGPYNQAVVYDKLVFVSGQIPLDPATGTLETKDVKRATELVLTHIKNILEEAGSGPDKVLKVSIFLKNMADFGDVNEVYARFFGEKTAPARETVQVAALPKDVPVEISCIAGLE